MKTMPRGVRVIGRIFEALSFLPLIAGVFLLFPGNLSDQMVSLLTATRQQNLISTWPLGLTFIITAVVFFVTARALIRGEKWAWWTMLILLALNFLSGFPISKDTIFYQIVDAGFFYYLVRKDVRHCFGLHPEHAGSTQTTKQ